MKNYFTSINLPHADPRSDMGKLTSGVNELIKQLRSAFLSIDSENLSPELRKKIGTLPEIYMLPSGGNKNISGLEKGALIFEYGEEENGFSRIEGIYVYTGEGIK